ncbi:MFS transporter [Methylobacterium sp. NEAU K]|uniref:MFS transporter n=1 Tax=Methylobacterium sp. NEAU K TaxID=3064946 RepID=UPI002733218A|nr:MFS transporter [Methylobacterium sp. NEAU K]MDP4004716.1 MFS transporter [Methylobacterium sp. NEAU K]
MVPTLAPAAVPDIERATLRRVAWRILPFLMLAYFVAFVDRVNAGFAALQMNHDIGLSAAQFGLGGGLFYISYVLCEVPSNLAMERFGARIWIARIMITWGLVSAAMAIVVGPSSFYAVRLLLGASEAGFFPGVILYLTYWFPRAYRGRIVAVFMVAIPISSFLGSPISASILGIDGMLSLRGWQWLFILEAVPAVLLGFFALVFLPDGPGHARWLTPQQSAWLQDRLASERASVVPGKAAPARHLSVWQVMRNRYVLAASLIYAGASGASQCLSLWQPQIIKSFGLSNLETGLLNAIPFGIASVLMVLWGRSSDRSCERVWHTALPLGLLALSLAASTATTQLVPTILILCLAVTATYTVKGPFWALSTEWLSAGAAAAGIAQINAIGNIGGFIGTYLLGLIKDATGSYPLGLLPLAVLSGTGCLLALLLGRRRAKAIEPAQA